MQWPRLRAKPHSFAAFMKIPVTLVKLLLPSLNIYINLTSLSYELRELGVGQALPWQCVPKKRHSPSHRLYSLFIKRKFVFSLTRSLSITDTCCLFCCERCQLLSPFTPTLLCFGVWVTGLGANTPIPWKGEEKSPLKGEKLILLSKSRVPSIKNQVSNGRR